MQHVKRNYSLALASLFILVFFGWKFSLAKSALPENDNPAIEVGSDTVQLTAACDTIEVSGFASGQKQSNVSAKAINKKKLSMSAPRCRIAA